MTLPIRYSPSGSPIKTATGGELRFGPGARLRLTEAQSTMGGSLAVPSDPSAALICPDGFGQTDAIVLTLTAPKQGLEYRAKLSLDVNNTSTNAHAEVVLYLDVSVDGGTTYTNRAKSVHVIGADVTANEVRNCDVYMPLILGSSLGVNDTTGTASIKLRARASAPVGSPLALVSSIATSGGGGGAVSGLNGSIHMELEECL